MEGPLAPPQRPPRRPFPRRSVPPPPPPPPPVAEPRGEASPADPAGEASSLCKQPAPPLQGSRPWAASFPLPSTPPPCPALGSLPPSTLPCKLPPCLALRCSLSLPCTSPPCLALGCSPPSPVPCMSPPCLALGCSRPFPAHPHPAQHWAPHPPSLHAPTLPGTGLLPASLHGSPCPLCTCSFVCVSSGISSP